MKKTASQKHSYKDSDDFEGSTKDNSIDDIDEGNGAKRPLVPSFEAFKGKLISQPKKRVCRSPLTDKYGPSKGLQMSPKPFLATTKQALWNHCITPCGNQYLGACQKTLASSLLQTQVVSGSKMRVLNGVKPEAFKNLKFGDDACGGIPRRARSGDKKKEVGQNINFNFWLSPREAQDCVPGVERNLLGNSLNSRIKVVINKGLSGSIHHNA